MAAGAVALFLVEMLAVPAALPADHTRGTVDPAAGGGTVMLAHAVMHHC